MLPTFCFLSFFVLLNYQVTAENNLPDSTECECVPYYLCRNGYINTDGESTIDFRRKRDIRTETAECPNYIDVCCKKEKINLHSKTSSSSNSCGFGVTEDFNQPQFGEFPWMVAVFYKDSFLRKLVFKCGGSLIHPRVVLTAAHCMDSMGEYKVFVNNSGEYQSLTVIEVVTHPNYHSHNLDNDISLLFLESDGFANHVACLPPQGFNASGRECFLAEWMKARTRKEDMSKTNLKKIELPLENRKRCQNAFGKGEFEGGPLVCRINGQKERFQEMGMMVREVGCDQKEVSGMYIDFANYRNWIDMMLRLRNIDTTTYKY